LPALFTAYSVTYAYLAIMITRVLLLAFALAAASPAAAACLSDGQMRRAIADGGLISPGDVMAIAAQSGGELVSARLCEGPAGLVYRVAVIDPDGRVMRFVVDAASGDIIDQR
jgi:uncharacterized membrane protein YkoI